MEIRKLLWSVVVFYAVILLAYGGWLISRRQDREARQLAVWYTNTAITRRDRLNPSATPSPSVTATWTERPRLPTFTPSVTPEITTPGAPAPTPSPASPASPTVTVPPSPQVPPSRTPSPTITTSPVPGAISGQLLIDGTPAGTGVALVIEDQNRNPVATLSTGQSGAFSVSGLAPTSQGYNLVFEQEDNPALASDTVAQWVWLGPITIDAGENISLPTLDISPRGFQPLQPIEGISIAASDITSSNPLLFSWNPYPNASRYWIEILEGEEAEPVWEIRSITSRSASFNGEVEGGDQISPGDYFWGVGALGDLGIYPLTVYGFLRSLTIAQ